MRHKWDMYEDMVVCSHVIKGDYETRKVQNALKKEFGLNDRQLLMRIRNFEHIVYGKPSFFNTCSSERKAFVLLCKHKVLLLII